MTAASGVASCQRMSSASSPPRMKKTRPVTAYRIPIFLWSIVVIQSQMPVRLGGVPTGVCASAVAIVPIESESCG
jgi:hypothetical protein